MAGRQSESKKAERIRTLYTQADGTHRKKWRKAQQKGYDFSLNDQLTKDQLDDLQAAGMPDFIINMITPIIDIMKYFLTANNPRWNAVGADGSDTDVASMYSSMVEYCWYQSEGRQVYAQIIDDTLRKSRGYMHIYVDPNEDRGMGEVMFDFVNPWDVYECNVSRHIFGNDANFKMIKKNLTRSTLIQMLPGFKKKIKAASSIADNAYYSERDQDESDSIQTEDITYGINPEDGSDEDLVGYYECYEKTPIQFVRVFIKIPPSSKDLQQAQKVIDVQIKELQKELLVRAQEKKVQLEEGVKSGEILKERAELELDKSKKQMQQALKEREQLLYSKARDQMSKVEDKVVTADEFKVMAEDKSIMENVVGAHPFHEPRIKKTCVVGDKLLYEQMLDTKYYPLFSLPYTHTGTPYSMSAVTPLVGKQQEINKAHQITVHNANLGSNLRWLFQKGQIEEEHWEKYSSSAGALLPWNDVAGNGVPPKEISPAQLSNAFFSLTENGKSDLEYLSGIHSSMMGVADKQPEPYRGMLANDEFGTRRLKSWINNVLEPFLEHAGKVFQEISQKHYDVHKVYRIVQPNHDGGHDVLEEEINIPIYDKLGNIIGKFKDYATARFDVRIVPGSTMPVNRWALIDEYFRWYQAELIDDVAMLAETDIKNKDAILKRKSIYAQMRAKIQQLEEALKNKTGDVETLERQVLQKKIDVSATRVDSEFRKDLVDAKGAIDNLVNTMKVDTEYQKKQMAEDRKRVQKEVKSRSESTK